VEELEFSGFYLVADVVLDVDEELVGDAGSRVLVATEFCKID
jgi:hypothetical protein